MADLVVIVPSRGRPHAIVEMAKAFALTCTADTDLVFAVDEDDPAVEEYSKEISRVIYGTDLFDGRHAGVCVCPAPSTMVRALNATAIREIQDGSPQAVAFLGDDHRPRTEGWDTAYLEALAAKPGLVYGNDRIQGMNLPTQVAMSASLVRALGHMAPPVLRHMYVDNYWLQLGLAADCITYLPGVTVEHLHPYVGTAEVDEGYLRVNAREMFDHDEQAFAAYWAEHGERDIAAARRVLVA